MTSISSKYSALRGEREYFKLLAANAVNRFGDSVDSIALSLLMYEVTGSASMMALLLAVNYLPTIILQPIAGAVVDRMDKKAVMVWMDFARGAVVALIALLVYLDALSTAMLFVCVALISTLETLRSILNSGKINIAHNGLQNINRRIFLEYGHDSGLTLDSEEGEGFTVTLRLWIQGEK